MRAECDGCGRMMRLKGRLCGRCWQRKAKGQPLSGDKIISHYATRALWESGQTYTVTCGRCGHETEWFTPKLNQDIIGQDIWRRAYQGHIAA